MAKGDQASDSLADKLDLVARLLAYLVAAEHDNLKDRAVTLSSLGLGPVEIARVCNTTPNTISVRLAEAKKGAGRKRTVTRRKPRKEG